MPIWCQTMPKYAIFGICHVLGAKKIKKIFFFSELSIAFEIDKHKLLILADSVQKY